MICSHTSYRSGGVGKQLLLTLGRAGIHRFSETAKCGVDDSLREPVSKRSVLQGEPIIVTPPDNLHDGQPVTAKTS